MVEVRMWGLMERKRKEGRPEVWVSKGGRGEFLGFSENFWTDETKGTGSFGEREFVNKV